MPQNTALRGRIGHSRGMAQAFVARSQVREICGWWQEFVQAVYGCHTMSVFLALGLVMDCGQVVW